MSAGAQSSEASEFAAGGGEAREPGRCRCGLAEDGDEACPAGPQVPAKERASVVQRHSAAPGFRSRAAGPLPHRERKASAFSTSNVRGSHRDLTGEGLVHNASKAIAEPAAGHAAQTEAGRLFPAVAEGRFVIHRRSRFNEARMPVRPALSLAEWEVTSSGGGP